MYFPCVNILGDWQIRLVQIKGTVFEKLYLRANRARRMNSLFSDILSVYL